LALNDPMVATGIPESGIGPIITNFESQKTILLSQASPRLTQDSADGKLSKLTHSVYPIEYSPEKDSQIKSPQLKQTRKFSLNNPKHHSLMSQIDTRRM
jgi:hypothetical protein